MVGRAFVQQETGAGCCDAGCDFGCGFECVFVHGVAHITGGGFDENIPRILSEGMGLEINEGSWPILPVFKFLEKYGKVDHREMFNIYNMGIGMVLAVNECDAAKAIEILKSHGDNAYVIGKITDSGIVDIK